MLDAITVYLVINGDWHPFTLESGWLESSVHERVMLALSLFETVEAEDIERTAFDPCSPLETLHVALMTTTNDDVWLHYSGTHEQILNDMRLQLMCY
ncbi:MAG: hypothetical protein EOP04_23415 [Proteobacteria bacterium]|nr:MAG: hypothetical protein EOP04_23415 [Pseudomonadota bacterium]